MPPASGTYHQQTIMDMPVYQPSQGMMMNVGQYPPRAGNKPMMQMGQLLKSLGIPTPRNPHYQALAISFVWPTPLGYPVTKYLASQEYNRDIPLATTIQEYMHNRST
jgi:hypothetical protein